MSTRSRGSDAQLRVRKETTYGVQPSGNYIQMPFNTYGVGSEQNLITDPVLGQGRDPLAPQQDVINVEGTGAVPVDRRYLGYWLSGLLGAPVSTDQTSHWEHVFTSGQSNLPSYAIEVGHPNVPAFFMNLGVVVDAMEFNFQRSGLAACNVELIAQAEEAATAASEGGTAVEHTYQPFSQFQGSIKRNGTQLADILSGSVRYSNNMERIETIRDDGKIDGVDPTIAAATGNIETNFANTTLIDEAFNGTPMELEFSYTVDVNTQLLITLHQVHIPKPRVSIDGPGGVRTNFAFQSALNQATGNMMTVTLLNDLDDTNY